MIGIVLFLLGLVVLLFVSFPIGIILIVVGLLLMFAGPYSYSYGWHGRRAPP
jgi:uncharacterized membrane protein HdeD (DUF308 family)